jgi:hypothetical protein
MHLLVIGGSGFPGQEVSQQVRRIGDHADRKV